MRRTLLTAAALLGFSPALACAGNCPYVPPRIPPVPEITISRQACTYLMQEELRDSADYKPGVDVEGRAVAPADLPADDNQLKLPETITVEIAPALAHWLPNQSAPYDTFELSRINLGTVSVTGGILTFNGQPMAPEHDNELLALCAQNMKSSDKSE